MAVIPVNLRSNSPNLLAACDLPFPPWILCSSFRCNAHLHLRNRCAIMNKENVARPVLRRLFVLYYKRRIRRSRKRGLMDVEVRRFIPSSVDGQGFVTAKSTRYGTYLVSSGQSLCSAFSILFHQSCVDFPPLIFPLSCFCKNSSLDLGPK